MEQKELPKGLNIDEQNKQATITLGNDVDLNKIIEYLKNKEIVSQESDKPDENGDLEYISNNYSIIFTICGDNNKQDKYSHTIEQGKCFKFDKKCIYSVGSSPEAFVFSDLIDFYGDEINNELAKNTHLLLKKDSRGNLSWYQENKNGKVYMCNHLESDKCITENNHCPDPANTDKWKPIKHTLGSNIYSWWWHNIDDYSSIPEKSNRLFPMKRFCRALIGLDNTTGECLCGSGSLSCFGGSGYNEKPFYSKMNINSSKIKDI